MKKGADTEAGSELEEFKKSLGPVATDYTDAQLRQLSHEMQAMAELLLEFYVARKATQQKKP